MGLLEIKMKKEQLIGEDKNSGQDFIVGLVVGVAILVLNVLLPGIASIGIPSFPAAISLSSVGVFLIVIVLAPIFETIFFFSIVLSLFHDKFKVPFLVSAVLSSLIFMGFHALAYGVGSSGVSAVSGALLSVFLVGMVLAYSRKWTKGDITGITIHAVLNFFVGITSGMFGFAIITNGLPLIMRVIGG